jgi:hypothetical protein
MSKNYSTKPFTIKLSLSNLSPIQGRRYKGGAESNSRADRFAERDSLQGPAGCRDGFCWREAMLLRSLCGLRCHPAKACIRE